MVAILLEQFLLSVIGTVGEGVGRRIWRELKRAMGATSSRSRPKKEARRAKKSRGASFFVGGAVGRELSAEQTRRFLRRVAAGDAMRVLRQRHAASVRTSPARSTRAHRVPRARRTKSASASGGDDDGDGRHISAAALGQEATR